MRKRYSTSRFAHRINPHNNGQRTCGKDPLLLTVGSRDLLDGFDEILSVIPMSFPPLDGNEGAASSHISDSSTIVTSLGSEALDHGREKTSKPRRAMSEDSIQVGEVLPAGGKVRSMIKKLLPWSKKDGNNPDRICETFTGALVGREHLGCEVVYEGDGDIRAE